MARPSTEQLLALYEDLLRVRFFEEKINDELFPSGLIRGLTHLYIGQEAVGVGVIRALQPPDYVLSTHRGHGHCLLRGSDPARIYAEILGRRDGVCRGKGGSMHLADMETDFVGCNPVVGANLPIGAGLAFAAKYLGNGRLTAVFFGDGAINTGAFHESANLAALWKLPLFLICENNRYAISVSVERASAVTDLADRAAAYGIWHETVDGMRVGEVFEAAQRAAEVCRSHQQPVLLVANTYRFVGHYTSDTLRYRPPDEARDEFREHDPVHLAERQLTDDCAVDMQQLVALRDRVHREIEQAAETAKLSPPPPPESALEDVYAPEG
ncbi:MAG TPA: thiamine pyrophosphate-dependent enzyme [Armatimonadota bacterium]|nr:thiamine pyrophosphate-dependent enzyme [Armatimonadota bacterium]